MKHFHKIALAGALLITTPPLFAADGVLIVQKTTEGKDVKTAQIQLEKNQMRVDMTGTDGEKQSVVFDGVKQQLVIINPAKKTYSVMTKAEMDAAGAQMSDAMAQMQGRMAAMSPQQRAQMQAMMGRISGMAAAMAPAKPEYRKSGTDKVGRWTCDKYEGFVNNEKVAEVCTVDPSALGFVATDFEVAKRMQEFFKGVMPGMAQIQQHILAPGTTATEGYTGVPIRKIEYKNGQVQSTGELQQITRQSFPASSYDIPAGFQKQDSPLGAMGRGRGRGAQ